MKSVFSRILVAVLSLSGISLSVFAVDSGAPGKIHHFTIVAPPTAKVGEAIDITVEAKDKDDKIITNYRGSIFFSSDTDFGATIPAQGRALQFKESDNGILKISKGVTFKRVGNQELTVTETIEDVSGMIKIRVEEAWGAPVTPTTESITITTPEKWSTITADNVMMSGKTKKNSKVLIKLNGAEVGNAITNEDGFYTFKLSSINQQSNIVSVSVVDGSNVVIGSAESQFNFSAKPPTYYNLSISPGLEVATATGVSFLVDAEPSLPEVKITFDGSTMLATEQSPGKYMVSTTSPTNPGTYPIQVSLKNILGQVLDKPDAWALVVKAPVVTPPIVEPPTVTPPVTPTAEFKNVTLTSENGRINMNFFVENIPSDVVQFKIAYGSTPESLSNEVTTFPIERIRQPNGSYNWYIDKLSSENYSFKIFGVMTWGMIMSNLASETLSATVGKNSCTIGNIWAIKITPFSDKTILAWDTLSWAVSYNIYRLTAAKDFELLKNVKEPTYTLYLSSGAVVYEDFAVRALCDDTTESSVPAIASRVQTGPGVLTFLIILSAFLSILFIRRKYA